MHINSMPDLVLRLILSKVPLQDLLIVGRVCALWKWHQIETCTQVRSLTISIGSPSARSLIANSCFTLKYRDLLLNEDGTRMYASQHLHKHFLLTVGSFTLDNSAHLLSIFPRITTLEIAAKYVDEQLLLSAMVPLLAQWNPVLKSLKMYFQFNGPSVAFRLGNETNEFGKLFQVINSMQSLKHLTLDSDCRMISSAPNPPAITNSTDLPILGRLREFYFKSSGSMNIIYESLQSYVVSNENLRQIGLLDRTIICNILYLSEHFPNLVSKIAYLPLSSSVFNIQQVIDSLRLFGSIRKLNLISVNGYNQSLNLSHNALNTISSLANLTHLHMDNYNRNFLPPLFSRDFLTQLPSVQVLSIVIELMSTGDLYPSIQGSKNWAQLFPNVQVIEVFIRPRNSPLFVFSKKQIAESLATFVQCPKLSRIYTIQEDRVHFSEEAQELEWTVRQVHDRKIVINVEK